MLRLCNLATGSWHDIFTHPGYWRSIGGACFVRRVPARVSMRVAQRNSDVSVFFNLILKSRQFLLIFRCILLPSFAACCVMPPFIFPQLLEVQQAIAYRFGKKFYSELFCMLHQVV